MLSGAQDQRGDLCHAAFARAADGHSRARAASSNLAFACCRRPHPSAGAAVARADGAPAQVAERGRGPALGTTTTRGVGLRAIALSTSASRTGLPSCSAEHTARSAATHVTRRSRVQQTAAAERGCGGGARRWRQRLETTPLESLSEGAAPSWCPTTTRGVGLRAIAFSTLASRTGLPSCSASTRPDPRRLMSRGVCACSRRPQPSAAVAAVRAPVAPPLSDSPHSSR